MSETRPDPEGSRYRVENPPPGNSKKSKELEETKPEKNIQQITSSKATIRKKSLGQRIKESFTGDDTQTVGNYLLFDVALPAFQNLIVDAFQQGIERLVMGDSRPNRTRRQSERRHTDYRSHYRGSSSSSRDRDSGSSRPVRDRDAHDFDQIVIESRGEAEEVLDCMADLLEQYEQVTVSDMYRLVGQRGSYMDDRWGWTHLRGAQARRVRDGYVLEFPHLWTWIGKLDD